MEAKEIKISDEEKGWVKLLAEGKQTTEVAKIANLPPGTFAYKLNLLRERVQCENMASLIAYFFRNNLID